MVNFLFEPILAAIFVTIATVEYILAGFISIHEQDINQLSNTASNLKQVPFLPQNPTF